jgi:hypothetical protein
VPFMALDCTSSQTPCCVTQLCANSIKASGEPSLNSVPIRPGAIARGPR